MHTALIQPHRHGKQVTLTLQVHSVHFFPPLYLIPLLGYAALRKTQPPKINILHNDVREVTAIGSTFAVSYWTVTLIATISVLTS